MLIMIPTIQWDNNCISIIDQRKLPGRKEWLVCRTLQDVITAIREMAIRGAPAIGVAASMGLALGSQTITTESYTIFRRGIFRNGPANEISEANSSKT